MWTVVSTDVSVMLWFPDRGLHSLQRWELQRENLHHRKRLHLPTLGLPETSQSRLQPQRVRQLPTKAYFLQPKHCFLVCFNDLFIFAPVFRRNTLRRITAGTRMETPDPGASPPTQRSDGTPALYPTAVNPPPLMFLLCPTTSPFTCLRWSN